MDGHHVFLSHNARDKPRVEALAQRLLEAGVVPWLDKWDLVPGEDWQPAIEAALREAPAIAVCVGEHGFGTVHDAELQVAINEAFRDRAKRVVPILMRGAADGGGELPSFLQLKTWVDYRHEDGEAFDRLLKALRGRRPGPRPDADAVCPYRGLEPFRAEHSRFFYGRARETERLVRALGRGQRLLILVGASGSGKSSLVLSGLVPAVRTGELEGSYRWSVISLRPGADPLRAMAGAVRDLEREAAAARGSADEVAASADAGWSAWPAGADLLAAIRALERRAADLRHPEDGRTQLAAVERAARRALAGLRGGADDTGADGDGRLSGHLRELERLRALIAADAAAFADALRALLPPGEKLLVVVDQLEELFTLGNDREARSAFVRNLLHAATEPDDTIYAVLTVRADFLGKLLGEPLLAPRVRDAMQLALAVMEGEQLEQAVRGPARQVGLEVEDAVVDALVDGVGGEPGDLPLLQFTLYELWRERQGGRITWESYTRIGGLKGAIAQRAEAVYENLGEGADGERDQAVLRRLLGRLVQLGAGTEDTRRRAARAELIEVDPERAEAVIERLVDARLLTAHADEVEVAHEALIREWGRLRRWIDEDRDALRLRQDLAHAARLWREGGSADADLWRGGRLAQALELHEASLLTLSRAEASFLLASRDHQRARERERENRRRREIEAARTVADVQTKAAARSRRAARWMAGIGALAALLAVAAGIAFHLARQRGERSRIAALGHAALSEVQEQHMDLALLLALEAVDSAREPETLQALLEAVALSQERVVLADPAGAVTAAVFAPDGATVVTGSDAGTTVLWQADGTPRATASGDGRAIVAVDFAPDGARFAALSAGGVRVFDSGGGQLAELAAIGPSPCCLRFAPQGDALLIGAGTGAASIWQPGEPTAVPLVGHSRDVTSVAWSPDGELAVTGSQDRSARIWHRDGGVHSELQGHDSRVVSVVFLPDGDRVLTGSWDGTARIWNLDGGEPQVLGDHSAGLWHAAVDATGSYLVTASIDATARVFSAAGERITVLRGHRSGVRTVAFSPGRPLLLTASTDGNARLWARASGRSVLTLRGHEAPLISAQFSAAGDAILTLAQDGTAQVWDSKVRQPEVLRGHLAQVNAVAYDADGRLRATASSDGTARLWNQDGSERATLVGHRADSWVLSVHFAPTDGRAVTAATDWTARVWSPEGVELAVLAHDDVVRSARFTPDGARVVTASSDSTLRLWTAAGEQLAEADFPHPLTDVDVAADGRLVSGHEDHRARLWRAGDLDAPETELSGHRGAVNAVAFSADGAHVATASDDATTRLWDREGRLLATLVGHQGPVWEIAFAPDGELLATAAADRTARVWRVIDGAALYVLGGIGGGGEDEIAGVAFSPAGSRLLTASLGGQAREWILDPETLIDLARRRLHRDFNDVELARFGALLSASTLARARTRREAH